MNVPIRDVVKEKTTRGSALDYDEARERNIVPRDKGTMGKMTKKTKTKILCN